VAEARAWTRKYFKADSEAYWEREYMSGMKDSKLISNPTQQLSQLVEEVTIKVPITKVVVNNNWVGFLKIRIGVNPINRV